MNDYLFWNGEFASECTKRQTEWEREEQQQHWIRMMINFFVKQTQYKWAR